MRTRSSGRSSRWVEQLPAPAEKCLEHGVEVGGRALEARSSRRPGARGCSARGRTRPPGARNRGTPLRAAGTRRRPWWCCRSSRCGTPRARESTCSSPARARSRAARRRTSWTRRKRAGRTRSSTWACKSGSTAWGSASIGTSSASGGAAERPPGDPRAVAQRQRVRWRPQPQRPVAEHRIRMQLVLERRRDAQRLLQHFWSIPSSACTRKRKWVSPSKVYDSLQSTSNRRGRRCASTAPCGAPGGGFHVFLHPSCQGVTETTRGRHLVSGHELALRRGGARIHVAAPVEVIVDLGRAAQHPGIQEDRRRRRFFELALDDTPPTFRSASTASSAAVPAARRVDVHAIDVA